MAHWGIAYPSAPTPIRPPYPTAQPTPGSPSTAPPASFQPAPAAAFTMLNPARQILEVVQVDLQARIAQARRYTPDEIRHAQKVVQLEDALAYKKPAD
ncbi:MAG: hypothetical protein INH43_06565 [Acidobacteriaceae bacterium]|nr:hypothetical protein [Acidobacteriaceae bacterium]